MSIPKGATHRGVGEFEGFFYKHNGLKWEGCDDGGGWFGNTYANDPDFDHDYDMVPIGLETLMDSYLEEDA